MRQLWLMRHGHAVADARGGDAARPLTKEGASGVERAGRALRAMGVEVDELWHSPFLRAEQTAQRVGEALGGTKLIVDDTLTPYGSKSLVADALFRSRARRLLVVSHLPLLPEVCAELLGGPVRIDVSPSTVVHLSLLGGDRARGAAVLSGLYAGDVLAAVGR